jgi:hypothetical protein
MPRNLYIIELYNKLLLNPEIHSQVLSLLIIIQIGSDNNTEY